MEFHAIPIPRTSGHTFRRRLPVWLGLVYHNGPSGRHVSGVYLRVGDRGYFVQRGRFFWQAEAANLRRLYRRVTALEKTLDAAGVTRMPVD